MLIEFRVKNFRSYRDEQVFSMVASSSISGKTLPENMTKTAVFSNHRLLRSAVIYGPNASGKSNLMEAFGFVRIFVKNSYKREPDSEIPLQPFLLNEVNPNQPAEFEITFVQDGVRYQYGFSADQTRVHDEWLFAYPHGAPQKWFERRITEDLSDYTWYFGPSLKGEKQRLASLSQNALFLSVAATFNHKQLTPVYRWFSQKFRGIRLSEMSNYLELWTANYIHKNHENASLTRHLMRFADIGVKGLKIEAETHSEQNIPQKVLAALPEELRESATSVSGTQLDIQLNHAGEIEKYFDFDDESLGTRRLFALSGPWNNAINEGHILFIDELDASLHPILIKELLLLFNKAMADTEFGGQIIFNTHDVTLLDSAIFRRDQIWFTEKDKQGATHLYPLLDYSPRKNESLVKGYLQGRYGAIPFVEGMLEAF